MLVPNHRGRSLQTNGKCSKLFYDNNHLQPLDFLHNIIISSQDHCITYKSGPMLQLFTHPLPKLTLNLQTGLLGNNSQCNEIPGTP